VPQQVQPAAVPVVALLTPEADGIKGIGRVRRARGLERPEGVEGRRGAHLQERGLARQVQRHRLDSVALGVKGVGYNLQRRVIFKLEVKAFPYLTRVATYKAFLDGPLAINRF